MSDLSKSIVVPRFLCFLCLPLLLNLVSCASSGQQEQMDDSLDNQEENIEQVDQGENIENDFVEENDNFAEDGDEFDSDIDNDLALGNEIDEIESLDELMNNDSNENLNLPNEEGLVNNSSPNDVALPSAEMDQMVGSEFEREVRFVQINDAVVYSEPRKDALEVVTLMKGDPLVVLIQGDWAEITKGRYIQSSKLSKKAVPHDKEPSVWLEPLKMMSQQ